MKTAKPIFTALAGCCIAIILGHNALYATTNVPRGGAVVNQGAGGNLIQLELKNTTGETATDVTVTIYKDDGSAVPNISGMDIPTIADFVDDNNNGQLDPGPTEADHQDSSPGNTCRIIGITAADKIGNNSTVQVNITFDGNTPAGTKLSVRFSKENGGTHYDMCSIAPLNGTGSTALANIPVGTILSNVPAWNLTTNDIHGFAMQLPNGNPQIFASVSIAPPYQASTVQIMGGNKMLNIIPNPPLAPFDMLEVNMQITPAPMASGVSLSAVTIEATPHTRCINPLLTSVNSFCSSAGGTNVYAAVSYDDSPRYCKDFTITNSTGQAASDLHVTFTGTGGSLETAVITAPPGCGAPQIPSNGKVTNTAEIVWPSACIPAGGSVTIRVCTMNGPLAFAGGYWTNNNNSIGAVNAPDIVDAGNDQGAPGDNYIITTDAFTANFVPDGSGQQTEMLPNPFLPPLAPYNVQVFSPSAPTCTNQTSAMAANCVSCTQLAGSPMPLAEYPRIYTPVNTPINFVDSGNPVIDLNIMPPVMINPSDAFVCGIDYSVSVLNGNWSFVSSRPAPFAIEVVHNNGLIDQYVVEAGVNSTNAGTTAGTCEGGDATEIDCGTPDVAVVSTGLGFEDGWGDLGADAGNIHEAAQAICDAYEANGNNPVSVTIDAHGSSGSIEIGGETLTIDNISDFADAVAGKISQLNVFGCSVAEGADGIAFICALEEALGCNVVASTGVMSDTGEDPNQWFTEGEMVSWTPPSNPIIYSVSPSVVAPGELVQVHGSGFDYLQPGCHLYLTGAFNITYNGPFHTWQNNLIIFEMPCAPDPIPIEIVPLQLQAIRPDGFFSNQMPIGYQTPQEAYFVTPRPGQHITNQPIWLQAVPEGVSSNYVQANFYYQNTPTSPWVLIGTDTDGTAPGIGTVLPIGSGNGWSVMWNPGSQPFEGAWRDLRVAFDDVCGNTIETIIPIFIDPTPLAPVIDYNLSKLTGNRLFDDDFINIHIFIADEDATALSFDWMPLHWNWTRALEAMGQQGSGIEDKEGDDASDMACGPVSAASCLRYYKDQFADIDSVAIDSLAQLIACHAGTDDTTGTTADGLIKGIKEVLKGLGINTDGWKAEWHDAKGSEKTIMADMIKCLTKDSADVIPLFYQNANKDINGDGVINHDETDTIPDDKWGHFVTLSSHHTGIRDYIIPPIPPGQHVMGTVEFIDFMDPWTGATEDYEIDNTTTPPELKGNLPFVVDTCAQGNTQLRGFIKVKPPAAGGGSNEQRLASAASGLPSSANAMSSLTIPLSGPGNYVVSIPSGQFELGTSIATLTASDADGNQESTNVLLYVGGCNNADFYHYQTTAPLTIQFTDVSTYNLPPDAWEWDFNGDNIADATGQNPLFTFPATGSYIVRMYVTTGTCTDAAAHTVTVTATPPPRLYGSVLLEGPDDDSGLMSTNLLAAGLLPKTQPYNRAPWFYAGIEGVAALPPNTTDWVLVELRSAANPTVIAASKAGFVRNDGVLMDVDGSAGLSFEGASTAQNYYILVRHRNHLAVVSAATAMLNNNATPYDFTLSPAQVQGTNQLVPFTGGKYALFAGDFNSDGVVTYADFNHYFAESSALNQYVDSDCNLNGSVTIDDFNLYLPNASKIGVQLVRY